MRPSRIVTIAFVLTALGVTAFLTLLRQTPSVLPPTEPQSAPVSPTPKLRHPPKSLKPKPSWRPHHGEFDFPFEQRLKYYRAQQKARHFFRTGSAKRPFDGAYPPGTFKPHVSKQEAKSKLLLHEFKVHIPAEELQAELDRIEKSSKRPDILKALRAACDGDINVMRHCIAEPIVVDRRLREIFNERQEEIQSERNRQIDKLRRGLTVDNFKQRSGEAYREITYALGRGSAPGRESMTMLGKLREILEQDLKQPGNISRLTIDSTAFRVYQLVSHAEREIKLGILEVRKLTFDEWIHRECEPFRP